MIALSPACKPCYNTPILIFRGVVTVSKFRNALYRFMYGRNGVDALSWALVVLEVVLSLLSSFIHVRGVSQALYFVSTALMFVRMLDDSIRDKFRMSSDRFESRFDSSIMMSRYSSRSSGDRF